MTTQNVLAFEKEISAPFSEAEEKTTAALKEQGFGVLTRIDVKATFKKKLDKDFRNYVILGACNPPYAWKTLNLDLNVGLMLPCNVILYEKDDGRIVISAINPMAALQIAGNGELQETALEVSEKLKSVVDSIS